MFPRPQPSENSRDTVAGARVPRCVWLSLGLGLLLPVLGCTNPSGRAPESSGGFEMNALPDQVGKPPVQVPENIVQPTIDGLIGEQWYGIYANNTRVGKYRLAGKRTNTTAGEGISLVAECTLEAPPPVLRFRWEGEFVKNGMPLRLHERMQEDSELGPEVRTSKWQPTDDGKVTRTNQDNSAAPREQSYDLPTDSAYLFRGLEGPEMFMVAASISTLVGKSYQYGVAQPGGAVPLTVEVEDREAIKVREKEYECLRVRMQQGRSTRRLWMTEERKIVRWVELDADGNEGVSALAGTPEEADSDLVDTSSGLPPPQEAVLAVIKSLGQQTREVFDLLCDYDAIYAAYVRDGRAREVSRSAFPSWFRTRLSKDANLSMSVRSSELLRGLLKTAVRGSTATVSFIDPATGKDFFRFSFGQTERGWLVTNFEP